MLPGVLTQFKNRNIIDTCSKLRNMPLCKKGTKKSLAFKIDLSLPPLAT